MTPAQPAPSGRPAPPPRVLVVEPRLFEDGGARTVIRLVHQWRGAGVQAVLFALQRAKPDNAAPVPADLEVTHPTRRDLRLRSVLPVAVLRLVALARGADVVVSGREIGWGLLTSRVSSWIARRPYVVLMQAAPQEAIERWVSPRLHGVTRLAYRTADRVVCVTPGLVPAVLEQGVRRERTAVVLNGLDVHAILAAGSGPPQDLPAGPGPLVVGVGRLTDQKGFDVLVRASAKVLAGGRLHRLLVLGEGSGRAELERLVADLGTGASVHLPGFAADPLPVLAAADLFVLPSRWEGFGLSLAEALVLGVPCVATDCVSGPRLLLADGDHGDLVPVEDADALAAAIERHLDDPSRLREAARRGRAWALEHLSIERTARDLLDVLAEVATRR